jgi:hypothetical protein
MKHREFLFEYSMAQILLLVDTWATRQAKMWGGGEKKGESSEIVKSVSHPEAIPTSPMKLLLVDGFEKKVM